MKLFYLFVAVLLPGVVAFGVAFHGWPAWWLLPAAWLACAPLVLLLAAKSLDEPAESDSLLYLTLDQAQTSATEEEERAALGQSV